MKVQKENFADFANFARGNTNRRHHGKLDFNAETQRRRVSQRPLHDVHANGEDRFTSFRQLCVSLRLCASALKKMIKRRAMTLSLKGEGFKVDGSGKTSRTSRTSREEIPLSNTPSSQTPSDRKWRPLHPEARNLARRMFLHGPPPTKCVSDLSRQRNRCRKTRTREDTFPCSAFL